MLTKKIAGWDYGTLQSAWIHGTTSRHHFAGNKTTHKATVLTSPAYRRRLSKAKKASPATAKSNPNKKTKSKVEASSSQKSIGINNATATINY